MFAGPGNGKDTKREIGKNLANDRNRSIASNSITIIDNASYRSQNCQKFPAFQTQKQRFRIL